MKDFNNKVILITGAGSGIGRETALQFSELGGKIAVVDVNDQSASETVSMIETKGGRAKAFHCDVASQDDIEQLADAVEDSLGPVDVLMNNAGIGAAGLLVDVKMDTWEKVMGVNVMGVINGCHVFVPRMIARGEGGHIINTSSAAAFIAAKEMIAYATSKFAVFGFSESLRAQMAEHSIGVSTICPGLINTAIVEHTLYEGEKLEAGAKEKAMALYERRNYPPSKVAKAIIKATKKNKAVVPVSPEAHVMYWFKRFLPALVRKAAQGNNTFLTD
ncbi:MAG: NAD(P)-dependent dehydrogenase (short-subunit alcohol dehydrogenase family) [Halioglobus sp.]|jgi:NAD(P)-dependent dehydrogenase (short-subunit alcohol dehydrogenase family)